MRLRRENYDEAAIAAWGKKLAELAGRGVDVYAFFKHEKHGPRLARELLGAAGAA